LLVALLLASGDDVQRRCPAYTTSLPPHPEQCLPTLLPGITGADPLLVGLSWLVVVVGLYAPMALASWTWRRRAGGRR
jgi:hypothetical protein